MIGLNFYPPSPRSLTLEQARGIRLVIGNRCEVAGVFVNAGRNYIEQRIRPNSGALFSMQNLPDSRGHFGPYGGRYVAETLMPALIELEQAYKEARRDPKFRSQLRSYAREYIGRPTPLFYCANLTTRLG